MHNRQGWNRIMQPKFSVGGFREKCSFKETHELVLMESFYVQETHFYQWLWFPPANQLPLLARCHPWTTTSPSYCSACLLPPQQWAYLLKDFPHFLIKANRNSVNSTIKPPPAQPLPFSVTPAHVSTRASWRSTGGRWWSAAPLEGH